MHNVLIDYENVHPQSLAALKGHPVKVTVFVGANQTRIPFDLVDSAQGLGDGVQYIKVSGSGRNALDFHIAYYLGRFVPENPKAQQNQETRYYIISKDTGFDPLVRHLTEKGVKIQRRKDIAELPFLQISAEKPDDEKIRAIVKNLAGRGQSRPRKLKTLANTISSLFAKNLSEEELKRLIALLQERKVVRVKDGNVSYQFPKSP